jgi:YegS/Rv2252/BmrU family lipid kinase
LNPNPEHWDVILNPAAGGGSAGRNAPKMESLFQKSGIPYTLHRTTRPGEAGEMARSLCGTAERLILVGGDGTVNEVVNGLMTARREGRTPPAFGVIPATTGNDFARSIGMPLKMDAALKALVTAAPGPLDVGRVDYEADGRPAHRYFALACHLGLAAEVGERANRGSKRGGGTLPYLSILLRMVFRYRGCLLTATSGGETVWDGPCLAGVIANGESLGGGMKMAPGARWDNGRLEFIGFGDFPLHRRLLYLPRIYPGTHVRIPGVLQEPVTELHLESDRPTLLNTDGETIGLLPARVKLVPASLTVLIPAPASTATGSAASQG